MAVPSSSEIPRICNSPEFLTFAEGIKRDLQVSIVPNLKTVTANGTSASDASPEYTFKFRCQRSNSDFLITAREMLEQFLVNHNIHVYPSPTSHTHKRGDSFAEAFPHFDSKVLSAAAKTRGKPLLIVAGVTHPFVFVYSGVSRSRTFRSCPWRPAITTG